MLAKWDRTKFYLHLIPVSVHLVVGHEDVTETQKVLEGEMQVG